MNITLTDKESAFLKTFFEKQGPDAKDNVGTMTPIHAVMSLSKEIVTTDDYGPDKTIYVFGEDNRFDTLDEFKDHLVKVIHERNSEGDLPIEHLEEEQLGSIEGMIQRAYDFDDVVSTVEEYIGEEMAREFQVVPLKEIYEPKAFFLILDEAKRYIEYQGHNLSKPYTYTFSLGYSNYGDLPVFRNLLQRMGEMVSKESPDPAHGLLHSNTLPQLISLIENAKFFIYLENPRRTDSTDIRDFEALNNAIEIIGRFVKEHPEAVEATL